LLLSDARACLLLEIRGDICIVQFPETGTPSEIPTADLQRLHIGLVCHVQPMYRFDGRAPDTGRTRGGHWFWAAVLANRKLYRNALVAALLINIFALIMPLFTMNVYDRVVPNSAIETLWVLAIGVTLALLLNY